MNFKEINNFLENLKGINDEKEIITRFLDYGISVLNCDSGTFFAVNESKKTITFDIVRGKNSEELSGISFGYTGIVGWCAQTKKDILVKDTSNNPVFTKKVDYATKYLTKSVIALNIGYSNDIFGIIEFINPKDKESFDDNDFELIKLISSSVSYKIYIIRIENSIFQINNRLNSTINNLSGGFIGIDNNGVVIFLNPRAREILKLEADMIGKNYTELPDYIYQIKNLLSDAKNGKLVKRGEIICKIKSEDRKIGYSTISLRSMDSSIIGSALIFQDIT
ncbi:MAG: GAF domain-containing protein [Elusimicrobiales bacterium]|jgi:putative methionine-R-sulfoxide reductase with GAF domain|nr:GAF domain-containing protein [Elusimicrobiales bacterium]